MYYLPIYAQYNKTFGTFKELLKAGPHYVDVFNADKLEANVWVVVLVLVAFTCRSVG